MRTLLILFLSASACFGQLTMQQMQPFFGGSKSTPSLLSLNPTYWWVSSDNPLNVNVTNWTDRVAGIIRTNGANTLRPTNSTSGVGYNGSTWLTNKPVIAFPTFGTFVAAVVPQTPAGANGGIICSDSASGSGTFYTTSGNQFRSFCSGNAVWATFAPGVAYVVSLRMTNGSLNTVYFTNNIKFALGTDGIIPGAGATYLYSGKDGFGDFFKGNILEEAWFFNIALTDDQITNTVWQYFRAVYPSIFP